MRPAVLLATLLVSASATAQSVSDLDPHVHAVVTASPPAIALQWGTLVDAASITVSRRIPPATNFQSVATPAAAETGWTDTSVQVGTLVEYRVTKTPVANAQGNGYLLAGIDVPFPETPRVALVVVDKDTEAALPDKLLRLEDDLSNEGWQVQRIAVDRTATPATVRTALQGAFSAAPTALTAAFLVGAVPRAFSGCLNPDGHPDHRRAWPADAYYADLDGTWTDTQDQCHDAQATPNLPGDGAFDQSSLPSPPELAVGRLDAENMPAFAPLDATALVSRYLDRDHDYRIGVTRIAGRSFVSDNFGYFGGEAFARVAWRDGAAIFGTTPDSGRPFFDALEDVDGYAFALGDGGGWPQGAGGVGGTSDFASRHPKGVYIGLFGSYFGDWSYPDDFLRSALLSSGTGLTTTWFARSYSHLHGLGALQTFGEAFLATLRNPGWGYDTGYGANGVHMALLGDPTLRMFVTRGPTGLQAVGSATGIALSWTASPDADQGYHVFRGPPASGQRLTAQPITSTNFNDATVAAGVPTRYRVVAMQRLTTGSGTFFNYSPSTNADGVRTATADAGVPPDAATPPADASTPPPDAATALADAGADAGGDPADAESPLDSGETPADAASAQEDASDVLADASADSPDAATTAPADASAVGADAAESNDAAADPKDTIQAGCGCATSTSSPLALLWLIALAAGTRRRRVTRTEE